VTPKIKNKKERNEQRMVLTITRVLQPLLHRHRRYWVFDKIALHLLFIWGL
jgi:hypothetical protein